MSDPYSLSSEPGAKVPAPTLSYQPPVPENYRPKIGLIGAGGITRAHLSAYRASGYDVAVLCDLNVERAEARRAEFFPDARVTTDFRTILEDSSIAVVDIATHPRDRYPLLEAALLAGKHVLSQKPFVLDLDSGESLCDLADEQGVRLAVNQNGRWAPHFSYIREAVRAGLIGDVLSVHASVHWDHTWTRGTPFEKIRDLVLYDFAIHWFDFLHTIVGSRARRVYATRTKALGQKMEPSMLAQAMIELDGGQASLIFDAHQAFGPQDRTLVGGTLGTLTSTGPDLGAQTVTLFRESGESSPILTGKWFDDGFAGTMGELLCAIEEGREPKNSARDNLQGLSLCFAAIASATDDRSYVPGEIRRLPPGSAPGV